MFFEIDNTEEMDLDDLFENVVLPDENMYIADENKAIELISELIKNKTDSSEKIRKKIKNKINQMFSMFSEVTIENEIILYERFMNLCSRLSEKQKIQKIWNKVVISFGGKVSAGKSKFINTISGIGDKLPVDQKTTTAIPTYIIKSKNEVIYANSVYGYSTKITSEALNAMAHEFDNVYGIGFSAFVDSIIIESDRYELPEEIALLDTPGYTKYDVAADSKKIVSDRERAFEQLSISDYLIWLIDIDGGAITEDDIVFIESLKIKTPILIVFTKADLKTESEIENIIRVAKETISNTAINCYGVTAYSANLKREFGNNKIQNFLEYAISKDIRNSDILSEFKHVEKDMRDSINKAISQSDKLVHSVFSYISDSDKIMEIGSLAKLLGNENQKKYILKKLLNKYDKCVGAINDEVKKFLEGKEKND